MRGPTSFLLLAALAAAVPAAPAAQQVPLDGLDVYGTDRLSPEELRQRYGRQLDAWLRAKGRGPKSEKLAAELQARLEQQIRQEMSFSWVGLCWSDYFVEGARKAFVTVDAVEPKDRKTRMNFRRTPTGSVRDPEGLLAAWNEYDALGWKLFGAGEVVSDHSACPSYFCRWSSQNPELQAFEARFLAQATPQRETLLKVLREDRDPANRANATFLLSYLKEANDSAKLLVEAVQDPHPLVRAAALTVYSDLAVYSKDVPLPLLEITTTLDAPSCDERNKGLAVVAGMAGNPIYRRFIIQKVAPQILRLLQQSQPAIQDTAYAALGILAKEGYDRRDLESWRRWLERSQREAEATSTDTK